MQTQLLGTAVTIPQEVPASAHQYPKPKYNQLGPDTQLRLIKPSLQHILV